ncbi:hypothetical protein V6N13_044304 [Hibiscus sabdariffa]|uniref:Uncharacterized protein n=1 Tax=Hibiscus sabdariffa TaxID=183260 RepID=A0ABR2RHZ2_9ROSI
MVFRFNEEGGLKTEDGLFLIEASGVFSKVVSFESGTENTFFLWVSGVEGELIWIRCNASFDEFEQPGSSLSFISDFLLSVLGIAWTLLRMGNGDLELEQWLA